MIYRILALVVLLSTSVFGQAIYQDDDLIQYGKADSTITVDTSFQLWLFVKGPKDTSYQSVQKILRKRQFTVKSDASIQTRIWRNDTLFLPINSQTALPNILGLTWTAPGDDGDVGTATEYDIRWSTVNITPSNWNSRTQITGEPLPRVAGTPEEFTFPFTFTSGVTYYFALEARDEAFNWSPLSNVLSITSSQSTPDSSFSYMMFTAWNRWDGTKWVSGSQGPTVKINVSTVVLPQGETFMISPDNPWGW